MVDNSVIINIMDMIGFMLTGVARHLKSVVMLLYQSTFPKDAPQFLITCDFYKRQ